MEKVLRKRAWRDLKENKFRYLALAFLIIISMYLVISLVGAADTIVDGTAKQAKKHKVEDGQFQVFVPLTTKQKENLTKKGITLEETFYLDFRQKDGSKLRIFKNRKKVDQINLDEGRLARDEQEVVVEKRYAQEHNLKIGSNITIDGESYKVTGIGSVPDYDACYEKLSYRRQQAVWSGICDGRCISESKKQRKQHPIRRIYLCVPFKWCNDPETVKKQTKKDHI